MQEKTQRSAMQQIPSVCTTSVFPTDLKYTCGGSGGRGGRGFVTCSNINMNLSVGRLLADPSRDSKENRYRRRRARDHCPLVKQSQMASCSRTDNKKKTKWVAKYTLVAVNIPGRRAQVKSMCGKPCNIQYILTIYSTLNVRLC